jgi:hypothetical protein
MSNCMRCDAWLFGEIERDTGLCGACADREYERHMANREWEHFHPHLTDEDDEATQDKPEPTAKGKK